MAIPAVIFEPVDKMLDEYCSKKLPAHVSGKIRYGHVTKGMSVTLFEEQPHFQKKSKWVRHDVARFKYNKTDDVWALYYADQNGKWHIFPPAAEMGSFKFLLYVVEKDLTGIFWG